MFEADSGLPLVPFRVFLHSRSAMWEFYEGYVDVRAVDAEDAEGKARRRLRATSFPDRPLDAWVVDRVEGRP